MTKATQNGSLVSLSQDICTIVIPYEKLVKDPNPKNDKLISKKWNRWIIMNNLPEISDSKTAVYNSEGIIGRSVPMYSYSHSADRVINFQIHFFIVDKDDEFKNLSDLRAIQSAVYPRQGQSGLPYKPPPICKLKCGHLVSTGEWVCVVLQSYSVRFPTEVAWETQESTFCPYRFDVDTSWLVVYSSASLPDQNRIINSGR